MKDIMISKLSIIFCICIFMFGCQNEIERELKNNSRHYESLFELKDSRKLFDKIEVSSSKETIAAEYIAWVRDSNTGFKKEKTIGSFHFTLLEKPAEYMALIDAGPNNVTRKVLDSLYKSYQKMSYYEIKISAEEVTGELMKYGISGMVEYQNRIAYYSFGVQDDVQLLLNDKDTVNCAMSHFERSYDATPYCILQFAFRNEDVKSLKSKTFLFNDRVFGNGTIKLRYDYSGKKQIASSK